MNSKIKIVLCIFCLHLCTPQYSSAQTWSMETQTFLDQFKSKLADSVVQNTPWQNPKFLIQFGHQNLYFGNNTIGNELMQYGLSKLDTIKASDYHEASVQNTKNGNYIEAIAALEKAIQLDPTYNGYYGWVLLYYYHDYEKALKHLEIYDALTPQFNDAAVGEDIHFLKGLAYLQLKNYEAAILEFDQNIKHYTKTFGKKWTNPYCSFYKGRCYQALNKLKKANLAFDTAIKIDSNCTEAYYYKGLNLIQMKKMQLAKPQLNKALALIKSGYKQTDVYVELFDEVYLADIELAIKKF
jgi:tetratricopeptide (TPR) repeat protein